MTAATDAVLFENADWTVTATGLEHKGTGYFIARERLDDRRSDGLWTWPLHMLEKTWCAPHVFAEAFGAAVKAYGLADRTLSASFGAAFRSRLDPAIAAILRRRTGVAIRRADAAVGARGRGLERAQSRPEPWAPLRAGSAIAPASAP